MRYSNLIYFVLTVLVVSSLAGFSMWRNEWRNDLETRIAFQAPPRFLSKSDVEELLVRSRNMVRDSLNLYEIEKFVEELPEVQNAEVYLYPEGVLEIEIRERKPLFMVKGSKSYFVDKYGVKFSESPNFKSQLPVFSGDVPKEKIQETITFIIALQSDAYLKGEMTQLYLKNIDYVIEMKSYPFDVVFGTSVKIAEKIKKLKVFCAYQKSQDTLKGYSTVNLKFKNQIVATSAN